MNEELVDYIKTNIFPRYDKFYSHGMVHVQSVINNMMFLSEEYNLDKNMSYTVAAYHDLGLIISRETHEIESANILESDTNLKKYFDMKEIKIMKEAVEDHRGSQKQRPRNIYGEVLSDSDRDFDIEQPFSLPSAKNSMALKYNSFI